VHCELCLSKNASCESVDALFLASRSNDSFLSHCVEEWQATVTDESQPSTGNMPDCSAWDHGINSHRWRFVYQKTIVADSLRHRLHILTTSNKHSLYSATCFAPMTVLKWCCFHWFCILTVNELQLQNLLQAVEQQRKTAGTLNL